MISSAVTLQLPALQVALPLISAPLGLLLRRHRLVWALAVVVCWTSLAIAWLLLQQVLAQGTISYAMGGWAAPWGIEYRIDAVNAFVALIVTGIASVVVPYARRSVEREIDEGRITYFYVLLLLCFTGLLGMTVTGDVFNLFVFLEISSLSTYALISLGRDRRALTAAFQYLIMGTIGGTFVLIGVGFLYVVTGTLNMADLANRLPEVTQLTNAAYGLRIPRGRYRPEAGDVPAAPVAAECLRLCTQCGHDLHGCYLDQGRCLRPAPIYRECLRSRHLLRGRAVR